MLDEVKCILIVVIGFIFAQIFVDWGLRVIIGNFKFEHMYLGFILMGLGYLWSKNNPGGIYLMYFGFGIFLNDLMLDTGLFG